MVQTKFMNDPDCLILVATDAAGAWLNLQRANLLVNYDLAWNPSRIEPANRRPMPARCPPDAAELLSYPSATIGK